MVVFGISVLQGTIIQVDCEPSIVVRDFKQQCTEAASTQSPSSVNEDLGHLMKDYDPDKLFVVRRYDGIRLVHWNGEFMDDCKTIASQVSSWGEDEFMFKLVFMKQYNLTDQEKDLLSKFAQGYRDSVVTMPKYGTLLPHHSPPSAKFMGWISSPSTSNPNTGPSECTSLGSTHRIANWQ